MIDENEKKFFTYVNNNTLNKDSKIYNYYALIKENNDYNNKLKNIFIRLTILLKAYMLKLVAIFQSIKYLIKIFYIVLKIY